MRWCATWVAWWIFASVGWSAERLNVLMIAADDLRCDLGCYGGPAKTPNLDRLAQRGVRFARAYCQQALCNPSRSSLLTGRRPDTLHLWHNGTHFREHNPHVETLPGWFKQAGYHTRCVGKIFHNWHTTPKGDRDSWSAEEFLHYAHHGSDLPQLTGPYPPNHASDSPRRYGKAPLCECRDVPDSAYFDGRIADEAVRVLRQVKDRPFFLAVGFWKPHAPFNAPKKYWDLYDRAQLPPLDPRRPNKAPEVAFHDGRELRGIPPQAIDFSPQQIAEIRHGYLACISYMDAQIGKVLAELEALQLTERTIIVFFSDHGYHLGELGLWAKTSNFERDARVPLLLVPPRCPQAGKVATAPVELLDLFPTLCDLAQLQPPSGLEGVSLKPTLHDVKQAPKSIAFTQHPRPAYFDRTPHGVPEVMGYSIRTAKVRYTEWRDWQTGKVVARELYLAEVTEAESGNRIEQIDANDPHFVEAKTALHRQFPPQIAPAAR